MSSSQPSDLASLASPAACAADATAIAFPILTFSAAERAAGRPTPESVGRALELFDAHGAILLRGAYEPSDLAELDRHYRARYRLELRKPNQPDRRRLFTVDVEGPFAESGYYANPLFFPILQRLLGEDCILGACSSVVSWPGAPPALVHRDSDSLYGDFALDVQLPTYAVTVRIPLVRADSTTGSTRIWLRTHRIPDFETARAMPSVAHEVEPGSVLLTDSRVLHGGEPNRSDSIRPLLYNDYHRAWFRDLGGYELRPPVNLGWRGALAIDPEHRHMFRIAQERSPAARARWVLRRTAARWIPTSLRELGKRIRRVGGTS